MSKLLGLGVRVTKVSHLPLHKRCFNLEKYNPCQDLQCLERIQQMGVKTIEKGCLRIGRRVLMPGKEGEVCALACDKT
eukprot:4538709-Amphidinium_carterae.1